MGAALAVSGVIGAAGGLGCRRKPKVEEVKRDPVEKRKLPDDIPQPDGLVAEIVTRDPESLAERATEGAGLREEIGGAPYDRLIDSVRDDSVKKVLRALDPHRPIAAVALMRFERGQKPHGAAAAYVRDPDVAGAVLVGLAKSGNAKSWASKVLATTVYEPGEVEVALMGDVVVVADDRPTMEAAGRYVAARAIRGTEAGHDAVVRVPMTKVGPELKRAGTREWEALEPNAIPPKIKAALDPMVGPVLATVADVGDAVVTLDADADVVRIDERVPAKGAFSAWLSSYPAGDASSLLAMPVSDGASLYRFPDGLGPPLYASVDAALSASSIPPKDRRSVMDQLIMLGKSLGHEVTMAGRSAPPSQELFVRLELNDPSSAKGAIAALRRLASKNLPGSGAPTVKPFKRLGAEGEMLELASPGISFSLLWAIRDRHLYVDVAMGKSMLIESGLDPAAKATLAGDSLAKKQIESFPHTGVVEASYGDTLALSKSVLRVGGSAKPSAPGSVWSYATVGPEAFVSKAGLPLSLVGTAAKLYMTALGLRGAAGAPPF